MSQIGEEQREITVEPLENPIPVEKPEDHPSIEPLTIDYPAGKPEQVPIRVPVGARSMHSDHRMASMARGSSWVPPRRVQRRDMAHA